MAPKDFDIDTLADLDSRTGSYTLVFGPIWTDFPGVQWTEFNDTPVERKIFRFRVERLTRDDFVHIYELELQSPEPVEEYPTIEQGRDDSSERKSNGPITVEAGLARPISFLAEGDGSQGSPERPFAIDTSVHSHLKRASRSNTRYDRYSAYQGTDGQEDSFEAELDDTYLMNTDRTGNRKQVTHESV